MNDRMRQRVRQRALRTLERRHLDEFNRIFFFERIAAHEVAVEVTTEEALREALTRPVPFLALPGEETA